MPTDSKQIITAICLFIAGGAWYVLTQGTILGHLSWLGIFPAIGGAIIFGVIIKDNIPMLNH